MALSSADPFGISVVIVNWNGKTELAHCLESLRAQTFDGFETIVVDNGSTDGSLELLRDDFPEVKVLATGENLGFAEGVNRGIDASRGPWIATLNNDAVADPRWLERLREAAQAGAADLGMLQPRINFTDPADRINSTGVILFKNATAMDRGFDTPAREARWSEDIFCPTAGAALYRRKMLDEVRLPSGVFDRTFFMYFEDVDLGWRCRLAGWSARYVPDSVVHHRFQGTSKRHGSLFVPISCKRNRLRSLIKNGSMSFIVRGLPTTVSDATWIAAKAGWRSWLELLGSIREAWSERREVARLTRRSRNGLERDWAGRLD
jgi:GT2 family glycosyltransferase